MENSTSEKMSLFLAAVDTLCSEHGFEFWPTREGWTGEFGPDGKYPTFACIGKNGEIQELIYLDGDGRCE